MTYRIVHKTTYQYKRPVSYGAHVAYLIPRSEPHQECASHELEITPIPAALTERKDYFGNQFAFFTIREPHEELHIEARSKVVVDAAPPLWPHSSPTWEEVVRTLPSDLSAAGLDAYQYVFESPRVIPGPEFRSYASHSFPHGKPLAEGLLDLTARIHKDFHFDSKATNVTTSPLEVLHSRKGVCQDFAHLEVACLRSLGLPARYVSGYVRTHPPSGSPRLIGADASHAWVSAYCSGTGWLDVDPTNNVVPSGSHVTLAWGRDYSDVTPVRGVILGGRDHKLEVGVDMEPVGETQPD